MENSQLKASTMPKSWSAMYRSFRYVVKYNGERGVLLPISNEREFKYVRSIGNHRVQSAPKNNCIRVVTNELKIVCILNHF